MKKVFLVFIIALSFAFISNAEPTTAIKSNPSLKEMIGAENEALDQCFIIDIPDENGKCYELCPPLWEREEIPCR